MKRLLIAVALLAIAATASFAADNPKTIWMGLQISTGTADLASGGLTGLSSAYDHSEYGFKLELWKLMSPDYAFTASGGIGTFSEEQKLGENAILGDRDFSYTQSSWNLRIGGDRFVPLGEHAYVFFGPGIEYWTGKAKFDPERPFDQFSETYETESTSRISLHARLGAHMMVSENWGVTLQAGQKVGMATYEEAGAKTTWWPSSMDGSMGLVFKFGGGQ
jgi:opacity protein-like surface antigen